MVVWKLDRLARSLKEGVNVLADWCQRGVRMIAITPQIDLSGQVGHLIASLLFGIGEIEIQHARSARPQALRWPSNVGCTPDAGRARALHKQGLTVLEIAKALGVKERTVYYYLQASE